jgi:pimeloyl-ACP methyl ester carboxylesterase
MTLRAFDFPVGYRTFHENQVFNYQLNRWHSLGYLGYEAMKQVGERVTSFEDWKREMTAMGDAALASGNLLEAAFFYRAAEFYTSREDPNKERLYDEFISLFYKALADEGIEKGTVPYGEGALPVMIVPSRGESEKGTIVIHGGFDSLIEEFYSMMRFFSDRGYEVIAFEGPGQGGALRKRGLALDPRWEEPAKVVLDYLGLESVTWLGISMGGYLCFRAAAFEPRIARVIALGIAYDYTQFTNPAAFLLLKAFLKYFKGFTNKMTLRKMQKDPMHAWTLGNLMYITDKPTPVDATEVALWMNARNLRSELVEQDVLILTGREDHFIPFKMHDRQVRALTNARSVTARVFTREEHAQNHCQIGNIGLALRVMLEWIAEKTSTS